MITSADVDQLAKLAFAEAERHPARSPSRRAACHLWAAAVLPGGTTVAAVRRAVESFGDPADQRAALELLGTITRQETPP